MTDSLGPEQKALHQAVGEVLHYIWDPIGVAGVPQARDEYDGYVDQVCSLLWRGASNAQLAQHLVQIADEHMGLTDTESRAALAAGKLLEWRDAVTR